MARIHHRSHIMENVTLTQASWGGRLCWPPTQVIPSTVKAKVVGYLEPSGC